MLRVEDLVSGEGTQLFDEPVEQIFSGFDWSPDGKRLMPAPLTARSLPLATPMASDRIWDGPPPCEAQVDLVVAHSRPRRRRW